MDNTKELGFILVNNIFDRFIDPNIITVSELARRIGVTRAQIYNWRKGTSTPRQHNLEQLIMESAALTEATK